MVITIKAFSESLLWSRYSLAAPVRMMDGCLATRRLCLPSFRFGPPTRCTGAATWTTATKLQNHSIVAHAEWPCWLQYWGIARYLIIESVCIDDCITTSNHSKEHVYSQSSSLQDIFLTFVSNVVGKLFLKTNVLMIHQNKFVRSMNSYSSTTSSEEWKQILILSDHRGSLHERGEVLKRK